MDKLSITILINLLIIVLVMGVFYRVQTNEVDNLREDMYEQLLLINESLSSTQKVVFQQFTTLKADTDLEIANVRKQLSNSLRLVKDAINQVAEESQESIGSLETQLYQVESIREETLTLRKELGKISAGIGDFSLLVDRAQQSVVRIITPKQSGSGAIIHDTGYILTNYHVILNGNSITVELPDRTSEQAEIIGYDEDADIAVLKIPNTKNFPALEFGDSSDIDVGDPVIAIGFPGGIELAVSQGVISATNRMGANNIPLFQTDVAISFGSSGGPLLDMQGKVIGINQGIHYLNLLGYERFGFAIKANYVKNRLKNIHPGLI